MNLEYTVDLDHSVWIPVPLSFPWNGYDSAVHWAADLSQSLMKGTTAPPEVRDQLARSAVAMATVEPPLPGPMERFWHLPATGGPERLVHLYITETEATTAEQLVHLARAGLGGIVQTVTILEDTPFDVAMRAIVIAPVLDRDIAVLRVLGLAGGLVFVIELMEPDAVALEELEPIVESLFRSIRLRSDHAG